MGSAASSASRIWSDLCAIDSDSMRARVLERMLSSEKGAMYVEESRRVGLYSPVLTWLTAYRSGLQTPFPYQGKRISGPVAGPYRSVDDSIELVVEDNPRYAMYTTPVSQSQSQSQSNAMVISPVAKAHDFFQDSLELLGLSEEEGLSHERLRTAYKRASIRAHPDKGGSEAAFDAVRRAYQYVEKILDRVSPRLSESEKKRRSAPVTMEAARDFRASSAPVAREGEEDGPPVQLSAKKLDMTTFNKLFDEHRLPDPQRDTGYGDWLKGQGGSDDAAADPRLKGKFNQTMFEQVFREKALQQQGNTQIARRLEPDALVPVAGVELGGRNDNYSAAMGAETQFTDLKQAYTTGSTVYQEVAGVQVADRRVTSAKQAERIRAEEMARVDPDEGARIAASAAALEQRERDRRMRAAREDEASETWADAMRRRLMVTNN
jgi:curved DNA-binding protein CbpA